VAERAQITTVVWYVRSHGEQNDCGVGSGTITNYYSLGVSELRAKS
jgi:hypothetical protein